MGIHGRSLRPGGAPSLHSHSRDRGWGSRRGPEGQVLGLGGRTTDFNILSNELMFIYYFYTRHRST